jgi:hypothetical protein
METIGVKEIIRTPKNETVLDFGQNMSAWPHIRAEGRKGDRIRMRFFEILDGEGNVYTANLRTAKQELEVVLGEDGEIEYRPHFTYYGSAMRKFWNSRESSEGMFYSPGSFFGYGHDRHVPLLKPGCQSAASQHPLGNEKQFRGCSDGLPAEG